MITISGAWPPVERPWHRGNAFYSANPESDGLVNINGVVGYITSCRATVDVRRSSLIENYGYEVIIRASFDRRIPSNSPEILGCNIHSAKKDST